MSEKFAQVLMRFRFLALLFCLGLVAAAGTGLSRLQLSADLEVFFAPDDPALKSYDVIRETYSRDDNLFLVLVPENGNVFTRENLAILEELTERAWQVPHSMRVDSIANYQHTEAAGDDLETRPLVEDALNMSAADIRRAREVATNEELLLGRLITPTGHMASINISIQLPEGQRRTAIPEAIQAVRDLRQEIETRYPGTELLITGKIAGNNAFMEASFYDITHIIPVALMIALGCIAVYLFLASGSLVTAVSTTFATICVIIASVVVGMGVAGLIGIDVTPPLSNAPTIILTLAVADCMHLIVVYFQARRSGHEKRAAIIYSVALNFRAVLLTSLTTIIGFLALNYSEAPPFQDLGNVAAIGIAAAWVFSILLLPVLLSLLPGRVKPDNSRGSDAMKRVAAWVLRNGRACMVGTIAVILVAGSFLPRNQLYDVWAEYFDPSTSIRQDSDRAREHLNGFNLIEYSLAAREPGGIADPEYLQHVEAFAEWLKQQPEVSYVNHVGQIMKRLNRNMHGDDWNWHRLPDDRELASQYLLLYEFSLPFGLGLTNQVNLDKSATRLTAGLRTSSTQDVLAIQSRAQDWLRQNAPDHFYHAGASSDVMYAHIGKRNVISMLTGSAIGLLVISVIIAVALGSVRYGLISLLLNFLPLIVGFGIWGLMVGRIGMALSVVSGLTMGIVVDYTVHILSKYDLARKAQQMDTDAAIRFSFSMVGSALLVTTIVLCVNFGLLAFSVFVLNAELGILTATMILIALAIDLLFLPPLLQLLDRSDTGRVVPSQLSTQDAGRPVPAQEPTQAGAGFTAQA